MPPKLDSCVQKVMASDDAKKRWPDEKVRKQHAFAICRASTGLSDDAHPGYLIDLSDAIQFADGDDFEKPRWVHLLPLGNYVHPRFGDLDFSPDRIQRFHENAEKRVRGIDLDIDYEHKEGVDGGRAAGWIVKTEPRLEDSDPEKRGLWALVNFTRKALEEIKEGVWRYMSADFDWEWADPQGNKFSDVLFGGALTNRPFMKNLMPINLSEHIDAVEDELRRIEKPGEEDSVDPKELRKALGLSEDASDDDVLAKAKTLSEGSTDKSAETVTKVREALSLDEKADETKILEEVKNLKESEKTLSEEEKTAKKFAEDYPDVAKQMQEQAKQLKEAEVSAKLSEWTSGTLKDEEGKEVKRVLPPKLREDIKKLRVALSDSDAPAFDKMMSDLLVTGLVDLSEIGATGPGSGGESGGDASEKFLAEVHKERDEAKAENNGKGINLQEATRRATRKHPELAEEWRKDRKARTATEAQ